MFYSRLVCKPADLSTEQTAHQAERDSACKADILGSGSDLRVAKEEYHRNDSANDHRTTTAPEPSGLAHIPGENRTKDTTEIRQSIVAPCRVLAAISGIRASGFQVCWQENVVERIRKTNEQPGKPDQARGEADPFCYKETFQMFPNFGNGRTLFSMAD